MGIVSAVTVSASRDLVYTAQYGTPVIDGVYDEAWENGFWTQIDLPYSKDGALSVCAVRAKVMNDENLIYFLVEVADATTADGNGDAFEIYLDETYSNSNGFTHIRDLQAWAEVPKAMPNIQECDGEIYLTFRDIYKFDKINHIFSDENKVLSFGNSVVYTNCTEYTDDKYEVQDELFTKLFITKTNDMYYYVKVDGIYTAYKYNKEKQQIRTTI